MEYQLTYDVESLRLSLLMLSMEGICITLGAKQNQVSYNNTFVNTLNHP